MNNIKGSELQIKILLDNNFINEAMCVAKKIGSKSSFLMIENAASSVGNMRVVAECEKMIKKL